MRILGITAYGPDPGAALVSGGRITAEWGGTEPFPGEAIRRCLETGRISASELDRVVFSERPLPKWTRVAKTIAAEWPFTKQIFYESAAAWAAGWMRPRENAAAFLGVPAKNVHFCPHDVALAAAAFFPSPAGEAAIVTLGGAGESASTAIAAGRGNSIDVLEELRYPHSLVLFAEAFEEFLGLTPGDHDTLAAAALHGEPLYLDDMARFLLLRRDGSFELNTEMFVFRRVSSLSLHPRVESILGPARDPGQGVDQHFAHLAASVRAVIEDAILSLADRARETTGLASLCIAGSLQSLIPPAAQAYESGHGPAAGAALWYWHEVEGQRRTPLLI